MLSEKNQKQESVIEENFVGADPEEKISESVSVGKEISNENLEVEKEEMKLKIEKLEEKNG